LALFGHAIASMKVGMPFIIENARTDYAERAWYFMSNHPWLFIGYGVSLVAVMSVLRLVHCPGLARFCVLFIAAVPSFWYFDKCGYLFNKFIG
jgi:hypothetical protein